MRRKWMVFLALILSGFLWTTIALADETDLFSAVNPDAVIMLDLSGSMDWLPSGASSGSYMWVPAGTSCTYDGPFWSKKVVGSHDKKCSSGDAPGGSSTRYGTFPWYSDESCSEPFYKTSGTGHASRCKKIDIAKRALFDLLDDDGNSSINNLDITSLGVRIGFMRYRGGCDTSGDYTSGNIKLVQPITDGSANTTAYSLIYCNDGTSCASTVTACSGSGECIVGYTPTGSTPLANSCLEVKSYLDAHKAGDSSRTCRQKFAIIITDGEDTCYQCGGSTGSALQLRRASVEAGKVLADAGYRTFLVGFGEMPDYLQNTLNWMAYYGGTDNPLVANSGDTSAYNPASVTTCAADAAATDPGAKPLTGYAFFANNATELAQALKYSFSLIKEATYAFSTVVSVAASRTADENFLYEATFQPMNLEPFWRGHLKKYQILADGSVNTTSYEWDAGSVLASTAPGDRNIWTYKGDAGGAVTAFNTTNMTYEDLGLDDPDTIADAVAKAAATEAKPLVVGFIRGETTTGSCPSTADATLPCNIESWKLGDIFRSNPVGVGTPAPYFYDARDTNSAFDVFRAAYPRTSANGKRMVVIGANDGQFHAFRTDTGVEAWSFIPPNFLPKLRNIAHNIHPTGLTHQYFVDGPVTVADVWLGTGTGTAKSAADWKTLAIFGEGRGVGPNVWSASSSCSADFRTTYTSGFGYYCGYTALDVTDTMAATPYKPIYKWNLAPTAAQAPYLGDPWSKMFTARVKISGNEKWVGFIGAGYNAANCEGGTCDARGKGFMVVDLTNGQILWTFAHAGTPGSGLMDFSVPANPLILDMDGDGFVDLAYIGDLGGNMWRFKFCKQSDAAACSTSDWTGSLFYATGSAERPLYIFSAATAAKDPNSYIWIYWGTGDKVDPVNRTRQNKFYAVKDSDLTSTWSLSNLEDITSTTSVYADTSAKHGWYLNFATGGEKLIEDPTLFGGYVFFTTYLPDTTGDPCSQAGTSYLWGVNYLTGVGIVPSGTGTGRSMLVGTGIASAPVISMRPRTAGSSAADLYITTSGGGGINAITQRAFSPPSAASMTNILYWKDRRLQ